MRAVLAEATYDRHYFDDLNVLVLIIRVIVGYTLAAHGYFKFFKGGKIPGTAGWFDGIGMKPGIVHAYAAATTELGSGFLIAIGFLTPLAAAGFVGVMTVAAWTVNRPNGFFSAKHGYEYNLILATVAVLIATVSPGKYSVDWALGLDFSFTPKVAFLIAVVLGLAGGIGQIAFFFRPPPPKPADES